MPIDPLPSWAEGDVKARIVDFVSRVTSKGTADFVEPEDRIATFDNDGTLWCEQPLQTQGYFAKYRMNQLVQADPSLKDKAAYKAFLGLDREAIMALGKEGILNFLAELHAGMTEEEFAVIARNWLDEARNPKLGRRFIDLVYLPQIELLRYLRAHEFSTFIVSAGGADFMRTFTCQVYGIEPENVIGSTNKARFEMRKGRAVLLKEPELANFDDREAKVLNIGTRIGKRPILAFGNSDGDLAMLRYAITGDGASLGLLVHHDDARREFAYDRDFKLSPLAEALDRAEEYGITLVSMMRDWASVFS